MAGELARLFVTVGANTKTFQSEMNKMAKQMDKTAANLKKIGTTLTTSLTLPIAAIGALSLKSAADFEQSGNKMQAISGATAAEMEAIRQKALQLGKDTVFSAGEAMQGMLELSKAGLSVNRSIEAIPGVLSLAAAAGVDVAQAAEVAANALNTFGLQADQVGKVADILAATANASSVEMTDLADSLQMVGSIAAIAGIDLDDVATALGLMGNNGIKGSDAGTSLKQMLLSLENPTDKARKVLESMNIAIYDQDGKMRPLPAILNDFAKATAGMTQEQRDAALATIFGSDAVRAANILIKEAGASWDAMNGKVNEGGAAQKAADANMKGLSGAIEYFKGTLDTMLIETGTPWLDMLNSMVRGLADLLSKFGSLPAPVQQVIVVVGLFLAAIGPVIFVVRQVIATFGALSKLLALLAGVSGPVAAVILIITGLIMIGYDLYTNWDKYKTWLGETWDGIKNKFKEVWGSISSTASSSWSGIKETVRGAINGIVGYVNKLIDLWNGLSFDVPPVVVLGKTLFPGMSVGTMQIAPISEIPSFHSGGLFKAPTPGGEGLALLQDGERVTSRGGANGPVNVYIYANDTDTVAKAVKRVLGEQFRVKGAVT